jgi:hypothetical protein
VVTSTAFAVYEQRMRLLVVATALAAVLASQALGASTQVGHGTLGEQRIALVLVTWGPQPVTESAAREAAAETEAYVREASFGKASLSIEVRGWVNALQRRPFGCDTAGVHERVRGQVDLRGYDLVAYLMPRMDCPWTGAYFAPGVWMLDEISKNLFAHELGHNWGVAEEGPAWICTPRCRAQNYASPFSVMGHGSGHFNAFEKWRYGWIELAGPALRNGTYEIARIDRPSSLPHALYVVSGADEYWIEHRPEVDWPVVHAGANSARTTPSRFPQRNLLLTGHRRPKLAVKGSFEVVRTSADAERATFRFRWTDRTRPSRPRIDAFVRGRLVTLYFPAADKGSGVDRYLLRVGSRRIAFPATEFQGAELLGRDAFYRVRLPRGRHRIAVRAVDRAGNRGPAASRVVRIR